ncbi:MAG: nucleotidyltransferase family protein [bacterium]|nr:nucleotidyltransferase family protein [bacterium]
MNKCYAAVVLAGGRITGEYARVTGQTIKALIPFNGKTCLSIALNALLGSKYINQIYVVGPPEIKFEESVGRSYQFIPEGESGEENIFRGASAISYSGRFIICCSDMPFIQSRDVDEFIELCPEDTIANYPIFLKEMIERTYPDVRREYVYLKDGAYTGGNLFLVHTDLFTQYQELITAVFRARKSQFRMCRLLGITFIVRFLFRQLTVTDIENKVSDILGGRVKAILNASPNLGMDIDLLHEYYTAREISEQKR